MSGIFKRKPKIDAETIIDVRSYYGDKNHLVKYGNYNVLFSPSQATGREALCGNTGWLARETPTPEKHWIVKEGDAGITTKNYCATCVSKFHSSTT